MEIFSHSLTRVRAFLDLEYKGINIMPIVTKNQQLDHALISEILQITKWLEEHIEVKFVHFIFHIDQTSIPRFNEENKYLQYRRKCKEMFSQINSLPQISIMDMKGSFKSIWCEFLYQCNFTISNANTVFCWDHLKSGILPISTSTFNLSQQLKNTILTSKEMYASDLRDNTLVCEVYDNEAQRKRRIIKIKKDIFQSSPTGLIQLKHAFSVESIDEYQKVVEHSHINGDWKNKPEFSSVHEMKTLIKKAKPKENDDLKSDHN